MVKMRFGNQSVMDGCEGFLIYGISGVLLSTV